jgi:hypothetical protein
MITALLPEPGICLASRGSSFLSGRWAPSPANPHEQDHGQHGTRARGHVGLGGALGAGSMIRWKAAQQRLFVFALLPSMMPGRLPGGAEAPR